MTKLRRKALEWVANEEPKYREATPGKPNYLTLHTSDGLPARLEAQRVLDREQELETGHRPGHQDAMTRANLRPFPLNPYYVSQSILDDGFKERVWSKVMVNGKSVRDTSVEMGIDMRRVGAIVRMKEIEKEWVRTGKELARPYHEAIMNMIPVHDPSETRQFEPINDLPVHRSTTTQIFYPAPESKQFTREDAAKVFDDHLLSADQRIPHPQMIEIQRDVNAGLSHRQLAEKAKLRTEATEAARRARIDREEAMEKKVLKIDTPRATIRIQPVKVEHAGLDGRGAKGVGWRYGNPFKDRIKGHVKIPTRAGV